MSTINEKYLKGVEIGMQYFYDDRFTQGEQMRVFEVVSKESESDGSMYMTLREVFPAGNVGSPFSYGKGDFKTKFIPKPEFADSALRVLAKVIAFSKNHTGFSDTLNERLMALEI